MEKEEFEFLEETWAAGFPQNQGKRKREEDAEASSLDPLVR
jgi:hypothetical protein